MGKGLIPYSTTALGDPGRADNFSEAQSFNTPVFQMLSNVVLLSVCFMCSLLFNF